MSHFVLTTDSLLLHGDSQHDAFSGIHDGIGCFGYR